MNARRLSAATIAVAIQIAAATAFDAASPAKAAAPVFNWTGFYIGLNAGGFDSNANLGTSTTCTPAQCYFIDTNTTNLFNSTGSRRVNSAGFIGGAEAGFGARADGGKGCTPGRGGLPTAHSAAVEGPGRAPTLHPAR